jgi:hypothetical protein
MQKQQKEKDYRLELNKLKKKSTWMVMLFTAAVNVALFWQAVVDWYFYINFNFLFARRAFFKRTVKRAHWVGHQVAKPHRLAFIVLALIVLVGAFILPGESNNIYWVISWGIIFSVFVIAQSFRIVLQKLNLIQIR